jgi:cytochrome P450
MILISSILYQLHIDITTRQRKNGEQQNYIHNATSEVLRTNHHIQTVIRRLRYAVENIYRLRGSVYALRRAPPHLSPALALP